jgi:hypothetical protein
MLRSFVPSTTALKKNLFVVAFLPSNSPVAANNLEPVHTVKMYSAPGSCLFTNAGSEGLIVLAGPRERAHAQYLYIRFETITLTSGNQKNVKLSFVVVGGIRQDSCTCDWNKWAHIMRQKRHLYRHIRGILSDLRHHFLYIFGTHSEKLNGTLEIQRRHFRV